MLASLHPRAAPSTTSALDTTSNSVSRASLIRQLRAADTQLAVSGSDPAAATVRRHVSATARPALVPPCDPVTVPFASVITKLLTEQTSKLVSSADDGFTATTVEVVICPRGPGR